MKLRRVQIENFRGITSLDLALGDTTVLIGENNTGKTAVLDALRFALREVRARRGCAFDSYDFHLPNAAAEPATAPAIGIRLTFREDTSGEWGDQQLARLNRAKIAQIAADGCASVILKVGGRFDAVTQEFIQNWEFQNLDGSALTGISDTAIGTLQSEVSYYYLAALRDAARHFDAKGTFWRPFLKESQLSVEKRAEIESKLNDVNQLIISSHSSFSQVVSKLKEVKDVVSMTGGDDIVSVDAVPGRLFDMLSKAQVSMSTGTGAKIPIGRHGEGTQSLAVLTLFNAFLQTWNKGSPIVALEEPEAHLHPSAIRSLWRLIEKIPGQKIISTHSGDLLSEIPPKAITRMHKPTGTLKASRLADVTLDANDTRKFNFHIRRDRGELLFARCWILGEGETEATLIPESARILVEDFEHAGIRFVTYQTGISLEPCLNVANGMGIHWVVLADNDGQGIKDHQTVRNYLNGRAEHESLFVMPEANIEQHLCTNGFVDVYYALLTAQPRLKVTVQPQDRAYPLQVASALPSKLKTHAAQQVIAAMRNDNRPVPQLFQNVIAAALKLAQAP
jgi:putative ATP-dependent endonuclease of the OLD family